ncbi:MAG: hypothetical protein QOI07_1783 [Verrucomicrobiota bacterium]|jgi:hypothetical protein
MDRSPAFPRRAIFLAAVVYCAILIGGCSAVFVAPYDETTDRLLTDLAQKTETAVVRADAGQLSAEDREKFYSESIGTVRTLKARAGLFVKNEDEIRALGDLEKTFERLQAHGGAPRTSVTTGLRGSLTDLQQIEIAKKRSSAFTSGLKKTSSTP